MTRSERARLALAGMTSTVTAVGLPPELDEVLADLMQIKRVGRATTKEILLAVALLLAEG